MLEIYMDAFNYFVSGFIKEVGVKVYLLSGRVIGYSFTKIK